MTAGISRAEFVDLLQDELGLDVGAENLGRAFDDLPGWDSVRLLAMLVLLEKHLGKPLSLPDFLEASNLESIYEAVNR
ncbi:acyl carrier protein [Streptosporangium sp. NPDC000095]|uniref:acyl carrier protein n=1 Tax=Streptosporangium sp. NPDC000095 TaxID=3366184 RepID=UPI0036C1AF21